MKIKKLLLTMLSCCLMATVPLAACGGDKSKPVEVNVDWVWGVDDSTASATITLSGGATGTTSVNATVTSEYLIQPDCENGGSVKYTATIEYDGKTYTGEKTVTVGALGHTESAAVTENYLEEDCEHDGSYDSVVYCSVCGEELSRETITVPASHDWGEWITANEATCDHEGEEYRVCNRDSNHVETRTVPLAEHEYEFDSFVWAADYKSAQAKLVCVNNSAHVTYEDVEVTCDTTTEAGWETDGEAVYTATYGTHTLSSAPVTIPAEITKYEEKGFDWGDVTGGEGSGESSWEIGTVTFVYYSAADDTYKTFTATVTHEDSLPPTCTEPGIRVYTATYGEHTESKTVTVPALGHDYEFVEFVWERNVAKAKCVCTRDGNTYYLDATMSEEPVLAPTCETAGEIEYTATYGEHTESKTLEVPALGHDWEATWEWSGYESATATLTCTHDATHTHTLDAIITSVTTDQTCTTAGGTTYTATVAFDGKTYTDEKSEGLPAFGHDFQYSTMIWNNTDHTAYALFTCTHDSSHYKNYDAEVTVEYTAPTCETQGSNYYKATVVVDGETHIGYLLQPIEALGHDYETSWSWNGYEATLNYVCRRDSSHAGSVAAEMSEISTTPSCTDGGTVRHIATVTLDGKTYTDEKSESKPAPGHTFSEEWSYDEDYHWHDSACGHDVVSDKGAHTFDGGVCSVCGFKQIVFSQGLAATSSGSSYTITGIGDCTDTELYVPASINGYPVTAISSNAFKNNTNITKVYVPDTVTSIGSGVFSGCSNLTEISLPFVGDKDYSKVNSATKYPLGYVFGTASYTGGSGITQSYLASSRITSTTFYFPSGLTTIRIRGGYVPYGAFYGVANKTIELSSGVKEIETNAFSGMKNTATVKFLGTVHQWVNVALGTTGSTPLEITPNFYINNKLATEIESIEITAPGKTISVSHFSKWAGLKNVIINDAAEIAGGAFKGCVNIESLTLPFVGDKLHEAGDSTQYPLGYIFETNNTAPEGTYRAQQRYGNSSSSYSNYCIPSSLTTVVITGGLIPRGAFMSLGSVKSVTLPDGIETIGQEAFGGAGITSIDIPDTVTRIEYQAFMNCYYLSEITLSDKITFLGGQAFYGCKRLSRVEYNIPTLDDYYESNTPFYTLNTIDDVYITVVIGDSVERIPNCLFYNASHVKRFDAKGASKLTYIGNNAFYNATYMEYIHIPASVETIGGQAFYNCNRLTRLEYMTDLAFKDSSASSQIFYQAGYYNGDQPCEIVIGASVTRLAPYLFASAKGVTKVSFEQGSKLTTIGNYAFSGLSKLTEITLPATLTTVNTDAFYNCDAIEKVDFLGTLKDWLAIDFDTSSSTPLAFGAALYIGGNEVKELSIPSDATKIGAYAMYGMQSLQEVVLPDSIESIGKYAFANCYNIESITLGNGLKSIGMYAFKNCNKLISVILPASLEEIGSSAFDGCIYLAEVGNKSALTLTIGSYENGYVAYYAVNVYDANATQSSIEKVGDYTFVTGENGSYLISYSGVSTEITLPSSYKGGNYAIRDNAFLNNSAIESVVIPSGVTAIGKNAFKNCTSLASVSIANSVRTIGTDAFRGCPNLEVTALSDSLTYVGDYAFYSVKKLCAITLSDGLTYIGAYAFAAVDASATTTLVVPDSVTSIGMGAFNGFVGLTELTIPFIGDKSLADGSSQNTFGYIFGEYYSGGVRTAQYYSATTTSTKAFYIPASLTKVVVTGGGVGYGAFSNCSNIETIVLPDGITKISGRAFYMCSALSSLNVPDSVTTFEEYAFYECRKLKDIHIPSQLSILGTYALSSTGIESAILPATLTGFGTYAFSSCASLTTVSGEAVTYLNTNAFSNCSKLESVSFPAVTTIYTNAFAGCKSLTSFVMPEGVKSLGGSAFSGCTALTSVVLCETLTSISSSAFSGCTALEEITIPSSVTTFNTDAFANCTALSKVIYGGTLAQWMEISFSNANANPLSLGADLYIDGNKLETLVIPEGVTQIKNYAFAGANFADVTFASTVESIGDSAFAGWKNTKKLTIPSTVTSIGAGAFSGWASLEEATLPFVGNKIHNADYPQYPFGYIFGTNAYEGGTAIAQSYMTNSSRTGSATYYIPASLTKVTVSGKLVPYSFHNCTTIEEIILSESVTELPASAFSGCSGLTSMTIPESVTTVGGYVFNNCLSLASVTFLSDIATIGNGMFYGCASLESIEIPDTVTAIGSYAFYGCTSLESIEMPDTVTTLGEYAFQNCSALTSVKLSSGITKLNSYTFRNCTAIESIEIPYGVTTLSSYVFSGCTTLMKVVVPDSVTSIPSGAFSGCSALEELTLPFVGDKRHGASDTYQYPFGYIFGTSSFTGASLTSQTYRTSSTKTGTGKYYIPNTLKKVTITDTRIQYGAFYNCANITEVYLPNATEIVDYAFYSCTSLTYVDASAAQTIGERAFNNCSNLRELSFEDATSFGSYMLSNCSKLAKILYGKTVEDWNSVSKTSTWNSSSSAYVIECTDGDIAKNGTITYKTVITVDISGVAEVVDDDALVYIYYWRDETDNNGWPGEEMTENRDGTYSIRIPTANVVNGIMIVWLDPDETAEDRVLGQTNELTLDGGNTIVLTQDDLQAQD